MTSAVDDGRSLGLSQPAGAAHHHADPHGPDHGAHDHDGHEPPWYEQQAAGAGEPWFAGPVYATPEGVQPGRFSRFVLRHYSRVPNWAAPAAILLCFAGAASYVWISNPTDSGAGDLPTCLVKMTTGLDCPGCGGTRAFYYLLHGNLPEAARHHALAVFAAPFLVWIYVAWAVRRIWGKSIPMPQLSGKPVAIFLAGWAVFMVVRNIPIAPFNYLYV